MNKILLKNLQIRTNIKITIIIIAALLIIPELIYAQQRLSINASIANMRSGPGTKYDVLWQVEKYHPVKVVTKKGSWYKIKDFEGDIAWIHKTLLSNVKGVITIKKKCNVRSRATTKSQLLFSAEKGVPFKVLTQKGNWLKIEHVDGDVGWIFKSLIW